MAQVFHAVLMIFVCCGITETRQDQIQNMQEHRSFSGLSDYTVRFGIRESKDPRQNASEHGEPIPVGAIMSSLDEGFDVDDLGEELTRDSSHEGETQSQDAKRKSQTRADEIPFIVLELNRLLEANHTGEAHLLFRRAMACCHGGKADRLQLCYGRLLMRSRRLAQARAVLQVRVAQFWVNTAVAATAPTAATTALAPFLQTIAAQPANAAILPAGLRRAHPALRPRPPQCGGA